VAVDRIIAALTEQGGRPPHYRPDPHPDLLPSARCGPATPVARPPGCPAPLKPGTSAARRRSGAPFEGFGAPDPRLTPGPAGNMPAGPGGRCIG
jgi:hypothetical protein